MERRVFVHGSGDVFLHRWTFDCYWHRGPERSHHSIEHRHHIGLRWEEQTTAFRRLKRWKTYENIRGDGNYHHQTP